MLMKKKNFLFVMGLISLIALPVLSHFSSRPIEVLAEEGSVGDQYFAGYNCTVESFKNKALVNQGVNSGFVTELTPDEGASNVRTTFKRTLFAAGQNATGENLFSFEKYTDINGNTIATADMIVITYQNVKEPSKILSIVNRVHSGVWNSVSLAFTDQIEYREDQCAYLKGTNQKTVGLRYGEYNYVGYIYGGNKVNAPLWGCHYFYSRITAEGDVSHNASTVYGNILNADFLAASRADLDPDSPYYNLYTVEYATELLNSLKTGYNSMSITYYNIHTTEKLAFRNTQINSEWLGENTNKTPSPKNNTYSFTMPKLDQNLEPLVLYTNMMYRIDTIVDTFSIFPVDGDIHPWREGWRDAATHDDWNWFTDDLLDSKPFYGYEVGKKAKGLSIYTFDNKKPASWSNVYIYQDMYFDFVEGKPEISAKEDEVVFIKDTTYDLSKYFEVGGIPGEIKYYVDDVETSKDYLADGEAHVIKGVVTVNPTLSAEASFNVIPGIIELPEEVDVATYYNVPTILPVPTMNASFTYTLELYFGETFLSDQLSYVFTSEGTYTIKYHIEITETETIDKELTYRVTLAYKPPVITVNGEYQESYYLGETIDILEATASDGYSDDFEVTTTLYIDNQSQGTPEASMQLVKDGTYRLVYKTTYGEGETVVEEVTFNVVKDLEPPQLIIDGTYKEEYVLGDRIVIIQAVAHEASGLTPTLTITVYLDEQVLEFDGQILTLAIAGTYQIEYKATNFSSVTTTKTFTFKVPEAETPKPDNTPLIIGLAAGGGTLVLGGGALAFILIKKKRG